MTKFISFPKIHQFADAIRTIKHKKDFQGLDVNGDAIYAHNAVYPTLAYKGTVKLHGTNAAIIFDEDGNFHCQSRENIITPEKDNAGFATYIYSLPKEIISSTVKNFGIYGEWCGGNIQAGVAINGLPKMFVIFAERNLDGDLEEQNWSERNYSKSAWEVLNRYNIYHIEQFPTFTIDIDFEHPEIAQNELIKITEEVEKECPVGKFFGKCGVGEGVVWSPTDPDYTNSGYWFKVKGEKHSSSKHKTLAPIDVEVVKAVNDIVDIVVTESRVEQGIQKLKEVGKEAIVRNIGDFIKWINSDIEAEEKEMLDKSGLDRKKIHSAITTKAKGIFLEKIKVG
jgi:hypothetical protein